MSAFSSPSGPKRETVAPRHESLKKEFDGELGPQPREYGEARLWVVARDAHWIFAYWEFDPREHPEAVGADGVARFFVRMLRADGSEEITQEISPANGDLFIRVAGPDSEYSAELGFFTAGTWCFLAKSGTTLTPAETGNELTSPAEDNGRGIRGMRAMLAGEVRPGEPLDAAAERVLDTWAKEKSWTPEREAMLRRLLAADVHLWAVRKRKRQGATRGQLH